MVAFCARSRKYAKLRERLDGIRASRGNFHDRGKSSADKVFQTIIGGDLFFDDGPPWAI